MPSAFIHTEATFYGLSAFVSLVCAKSGSFLGSGSPLDPVFRPILWWAVHAFLADNSFKGSTLVATMHL